MLKYQNTKINICGNIFGTFGVKFGIFWQKTFDNMYKTSTFRQVFRKLSRAQQESLWRVQKRNVTTLLENALNKLVE